MKVYLAGPMTGVPKFNIPAFDNFSAMLREEGHKVISPAELDDAETRAISIASPDGNPDTLTSHGQTWGDFLARDVKLIADTPDLEAIAVLYGWDTSKGARLETFVGHLKGLPIIDVTTLLFGKQTPVSRNRLLAAWEGIA